MRQDKEGMIKKKGMFGLFIALALLLIPVEYANSAVLKMPKPLPDIVKSYKSVFVDSRNPAMRNIGVQVKQGDYITIFAKGLITFSVSYATSGGPKSILIYQIR